MNVLPFVMQSHRVLPSSMALHMEGVGDICLGIVSLKVLAIRLVAMVPITTWICILRCVVSHIPSKKAMGIWWGRAALNYPSIILQSSVNYSSIIYQLCVNYL